MKAYDLIKKEELEVTWASLMELMVNSRQVELTLEKPFTDDVGYLTWDKEYWTNINQHLYMRTYSLKGRILRDYTQHSTFDLKNDFKPEKAAKIEIN